MRPDHSATDAQATRSQESRPRGTVRHHRPTPARHRAMIEHVLGDLCFIPSEADAVLSESAWDRRAQRDLSLMSRACLLQEKTRARLRLAFET